MTTNPTNDISEQSRAEIRAEILAAILDERRAQTAQRESSTGPAIRKSAAAIIGAIAGLPAAYYVTQYIGIKAVQAAASSVEGMFYVSAAGFGIVLVSSLITVLLSELIGSGFGSNQ